MSAPAHLEAATSPAQLREQYAAALKQSLDVGGETAFGRAYALGRQALDGQYGVVDVALVHHAALASLLTDDLGPVRRGQVMTAASDFFAEFLSPYEMTHRGFLESNDAQRGVNDTLEREAKRIARLLHDSIGQLLFALQIAHSELTRDMPPEFSARCDDMRRLMQQIDDQLHWTSYELYPVILEDLGLAPALQQLFDHLSKRSDLPIVFEATLPERLPYEVETSVYRATHEAVLNAIKHAAATSLRVTLRHSDGGLVCTIADNGIGLSAQKQAVRRRPGFGLLGMRERMKFIKGTVKIRSARGRGTEVTLTVPTQEL